MESEQWEEDTAPSVIVLFGGKVALVDAEHHTRLSLYNWFYCPGRQTGYAIRKHINDDGTTTTRSMHMDIMGAGEWDHRNGDGLDNRISNLRSATKAQQAHNRVGYSSVGYKGVYKSRNVWRARLMAFGVSYNGGTHSTPEQAARAYDRLAIQHHGEFAYLNFPDC